MKHLSRGSRTIKSILAEQCPGRLGPDRFYSQAKSSRSGRRAEA
jgi:hypothetical protein